MVKYYNLVRTGTRVSTRIVYNMIRSVLLLSKSIRIHNVYRALLYTSNPVTNKRSYIMTILYVVIMVSWIYPIIRNVLLAPYRKGMLTYVTLCTMGKTRLTYQ